MYALDVVNMRGLRDLIKEDREEAESEARSQGKWIRSRGTYLTTSDRSGQCDPRPGAECPEWRGTKKEIDELISLVLDRYPNVTTISIEGGYDSSDTFEGLYKLEDYLPMSSWWSFTVWKREES
jgi:hypothetical protein